VLSAVFLVEFSLQGICAGKLWQMAGRLGILRKLHKTKQHNLQGKLWQVTAKTIIFLIFLQILS
jgi:hypothetical protein